MAHTHEFDCIVCGAHFDDEKTLQHHNQDTHASREAIDVRAPAEPIGNEHPRHDKHPRPETRDGNAAPRYGSAGSGGAEFDPGPERD
jgi:hypothetical protein